MTARLGLVALLSGGCIYHGMGRRETGWSTPVTTSPDSPPGPVVLGPSLDPTSPGPDVAPPGGGDDTLAARMSELHARFGQGRPPLSEMQRATLGTSETQDFNIELVRGGCYTIIGAGTPQVSDLDLFLFDPNGAQVAVDQETDNFPVISHCAAASGVFRVQAKVYAGSGEFAVQLFGADGSAPGGTPPPDPAPGANIPPPDPSGDPLERRMAEMYARFGERRAAVSPLFRGSLAHSQSQEFALVLQQGRCYTVIGVGAPSLSDLDMYLVDPNGTELGQDRATDNFPVVSACPQASGRHRVRVEAYTGSGDFALQVYGR